VVVSAARGIVRALLEGEPGFGFDDLFPDDEALLCAAVASFTVEDVERFFAERVDASMRFSVVHDSSAIDRTGWAMPTKPVDRWIQLDCVRPDSTNSAVAAKLRRGVLRFAKAHGQVVLSIYVNQLNDNLGFMVSFTVIPEREAPEGYRPWWSLKKTEQRWKEKNNKRRYAQESLDAEDDFELDIDSIENINEIDSIIPYLERALPGKYSVEYVDSFEPEVRKMRAGITARKQSLSPTGVRLRSPLTDADVRTICASIREYFYNRGYASRVWPPDNLSVSDVIPVHFSVHYWEPDRVVENRTR